MIRGTTPTEVLTITNPSVVNLNDCVQIWATITDRGGHGYTFDISCMTIDNEEHTISFTMTQEETLALCVGSAKIQLRFLYADGSAFASKPVCLMVEDVRKDGVIE